MNFKSNKITDIRHYYTGQLRLIFANDESMLLLDRIFESMFNISPATRVLHPDLRLTESEILKVHFAVKQLLKNKPLQYILNQSYFGGLLFFVDERVLIPRPETEELVDWIMKNPDVKNRKLTILDIGTGSGCMAVVLKKELSEAQVWAMDVSKPALEVAKLNANQNNVEINFVEGDILFPDYTDWFPAFDLIVSNPPYVRELEKPTMKPNVLNYEPDLALFVRDDDPLIFYERIIQFSTSRLRPSGYLYFEINRDFGNPIVELLSGSGFSDIILKKDLSGNDRMIRAQKL